MPESLRMLIANIPDFPQPGVTFRDISPLLAQKFPAVITALGDLFNPDELAAVDAFAGVESRGFIFAAALAAHHNKNFIMPRKAGKLPPPFVERSYDLEYGAATLQLKQGSGSVIIIDDVIATGGTLSAVADLCVEAGYDVKGFAALIDLQFLNNFTWNGMAARSVIQYAAP